MGCGVLLILFQRGDFFVGLVAFGLHGLGGLDEAAAFGIDFGERRKVEFDAAVAGHLFDDVEVLSYVSQVQHRQNRILEACAGVKLRGLGIYFAMSDWSWARSAALASETA